MLSAIESADSLAAQTYENLLVVKDGNQDSDKTKALAKALNSDEVRDYINNTFEGAPLFQCSNFKNPYACIVIAKTRTARYGSLLFLVYNTDDLLSCNS